ncbi:MAG: phosphoribosylglycinamide formyltransferase [Lentisphaerae bacterium]|nr:phosphoribosylglycinamide formyltransferase [Lentisphaerota bacterium]
MKPRVAILISGRGSNMVALAQSARDGLLAGHCEIAAVIASRPGASGLDKAREMGLNPIALDAKTLGKEAYERALLAALQHSRADVVVLAGYMRIVSPRVVEAYRGRILNIHPADTKLHQGLHGYGWAFESKRPATIITVHLVDDGLDTGPILAQREVDLRGADTLAEVERRGLAVEHELYPEALKTFLLNHG